MDFLLRSHVKRLGFYNFSIVQSQINIVLSSLELIEARLVFLDDENLSLCVFGLTQIEDVLQEHAYFDNDKT